MGAGQPRVCQGAASPCTRLINPQRQQAINHFSYLLLLLWCNSNVASGQPGVDGKAALRAGGSGGAAPHHQEPFAKGEAAWRAKHPREEGKAMILLEEIKATSVKREPHFLKPLRLGSFVGGLVAIRAESRCVQTRAFWLTWRLAKKVALPHP